MKSVVTFAATIFRFGQTALNDINLYLAFGMEREKSLCSKKGNKYLNLHIITNTNLISVL